VLRAIVGYKCDEMGEWIALLECGHRQHVRHRPPWQEQPWVLTTEGRQGRLGTPLGCGDCDQQADDVGDPACWAHKICAECGAVVEDAGHRPGCVFLDL
jgi:hypothetical protein